MSDNELHIVDWLFHACDLGVDHCDVVAVGCRFCVSFFEIIEKLSIAVGKS